MDFEKETLPAKLLIKQMLVCLIISDAFTYNSRLEKTLGDNSSGIQLK